jgi:hypothetical protein
VVKGIGAAVLAEIIACELWMREGNTDAEEGKKRIDSVKISTSYKKQNCDDVKEVRENILGGWYRPFLTTNESFYQKWTGRKMLLEFLKLLRLKGDDLSAIPVKFVEKSNVH